MNKYLNVCQSPVILIYSFFPSSKALKATFKFIFKCFNFFVTYLFVDLAEFVDFNCLNRFLIADSYIVAVFD